MLTFIYVLNLVKDDIKNDKYIIFQNLDKQRNIDYLKNISYISSIISLIIVVFGVIIYFLEKKKEYKKEFNFLQFLLGKINCRHNLRIYKVKKDFINNL